MNNNRSSSQCQKVSSSSTGVVPEIRITSSESSSSVASISPSFGTLMNRAEEGPGRRPSRTRSRASSIVYAALNIVGLSSVHAVSLVYAADNSGGQGGPAGSRAPALLFDLFIYSLGCGWHVASTYFCLARAMLLGRIYDAAIRAGIVQPSLSGQIGRYTGQPTSRRPSDRGSRPTSFIWSTAVPLIFKLNQRIRELETTLLQASEAHEAERIGLQNQLDAARRVTGELTAKVSRLEQQHLKADETVRSQLLDVKLKLDFAEFELEDLKRKGKEPNSQASGALNDVDRLRAQIAERDGTIAHLLFDISSLIRDKESLQTREKALQEELRGVQGALAQKEVAFLALQSDFTEHAEDSRRLGAAFARLQNQSLDSRVFKKEISENSQDSVIIINDDLDVTPRPPKTQATAISLTVPVTPETRSNTLSVPLTVSPLTPTPSGSMQSSESQLSIPVLVTPRPSLPPKKPKLKPLLLTARFTTSASSRRLVARKRSSNSLKANHKKGSSESTSGRLPGKGKENKVKAEAKPALNPNAPIFQPKLASSPSAFGPSASKFSQFLLPPSGGTPAQNQLTPRTTRAMSVKLIKSRAAERALTMGSLSPMAKLTRTKGNTAGNLRSGRFSASRRVLSEVTNEGSSDV